jgi:hypothetical protein
MISVIRCLGKYLLLMSSVYFIQSIICWLNLNPDDFYRIFARNDAYAEEMFWYSMQIERMKVIHAFCLLGISGFLARMTARGQMLTDKHYRQMLWITVGVSILYVMPLFYIGYSSYTDKSYKETVWDSEM